MNIKGLVLLLLGIACVRAYPMGAPSNICGQIIPRHRNMGTPPGNGPQTGPFAVQAEPSGNGEYKVTLRATTAMPFKGFLIQAVPSMTRLPNSARDVVGMFQQDLTGQTQIRRCSNRLGSTALTHTFNDTKTMVQGTWQAPGRLRIPGVKFVATVVQDFDNFYVVHSDPVQITDNTPTQVPPLGPPASATGFSRRPFSDFQGNFQGPSPTGPTKTPSLNPLIDTSGARRANDAVGGGISVISNEQVTSSVTMTNTPDFIGSFSVTDSPPPPIVLPDGRVSSHNANRISNNLKTNSPTTAPRISLNPTQGSSFPSSTVNEIRRGPEIRLASSGSNIFPSASSIPAPSSDPLSQVGLTEVSFRSLLSSSNASVPSSNRVAMTQIVENRPSIAPTISSSNGITFLRFPTSAPTQQPRTRSPSFTTVSRETIRSVRRPIPPTIPVMTANRTSPSRSLLTISSRLSETNVNPPRSSMASNISPIPSVRTSAQRQDTSGIDTIVIPVDTQNERTLFEPLNFADIRAPAPTVIENIEGIPIDLPVDTAIETNTTNIVVNASINSVDIPRVQIINLPLLPEGQRAAVIDVVDTRPPETSRIVSELSGSRQRGTSRIIRPNGAVGQGQVPGMTQPGFNQGFPGQQPGNRFGQQTPFGRPSFGGSGPRSPFGQQFRPDQGQMFGRPGQFNRFGGQPQGGLQGLNLPGANIGTFGSQGQGLTPGDQTVPGSQGGQQTGLQPGLTDGFGSQIGSGNIFGGQFGTPVSQQGPFGPTSPFGQGFPGRRPFTPPGFPTGGRIQFSGTGPQRPGQFGAFGRQFGSTGSFGTPFGAQDQFGGNQGQFGSQGQFGGQFGGGQLSGIRGGSPFGNGRPVGPQFGRNTFGMNQFNGGRAQTQPNTFAPIPTFGVAQGQGQGQSFGGQGQSFGGQSQSFGGQGTLTLGSQPSSGLNGQSSGNLFNQLSQPNDNALNNVNTGSLSNTLTPSADQNQGTGSTGSSGLSSFAFGPFGSSTK